MTANRDLISILIADDDADDRMMAKEALEECRLANPVDFVEDGIEIGGRSSSFPMTQIDLRDLCDHESRPSHPAHDPARR